MSYPNKCTIWQSTGSDQFGQRTWRFGVFRSVDELSSGEKIRDARGVEFSPKQKFWTGLELVSGAAFVPKESDFIARGEFSSDRPETAGAQAIRVRTVYDNSMFGAADEYLLIT